MKYLKAGIGIITTFLALCLPKIAPAVETTRALSAPVLIPHNLPVRVQLSDGTIQEWTSSRILPPGVKLDAKNRGTATILCEDFTQIFIQPGSPLRCPHRKDPAAATILLAQTEEGTDSYSPPWSRLPTQNPKGPEQEDSTYQHAITLLKKETEERPDANLRRMLCYLYAEADRDDEAYLCYRTLLQFFEQSNDAQGQGITHYQLALLAWGRGQTSDSIHWAERGLELYRQSGAEPEVFQDAENAFRQIARTDSAPEIRAFAQHHLALLYRLYTHAARQKAQQALELYETLGEADMIDQLKEFLSDPENSQ